MHAVSSYLQHVTGKAGKKEYIPHGARPENEEREPVVSVRVATLLGRTRTSYALIEAHEIF